MEELFMVPRQMAGVGLRNGRFPFDRATESTFALRLSLITCNERYQSDSAAAV